jgi:hypothetical protein
VFERDASLEEFLDEGTELDAAVSKELLYSIFIPSFENPMHDGAVVIRDRRVWKAGCFLPLTASPRVDKSLGTRHRAAIGITEETDAVVVVVSEEKGAISICFNGNIVRSLDAHSLREALLGLFYKRSPQRRVAASPARTSSSGTIAALAGASASGSSAGVERRSGSSPSIPPGPERRASGGAGDARVSASVPPPRGPSEEES